MAVSSIYNNALLNSNASLWGMEISLGENAKNNKSGSGNSPNGASSAYSSATLPSGLTQALSSVMDDLQLSSADKLSFQMLLDYRDQLNDKFVDEVKKGLAEAGVSEDASFRLVSGPYGSGLQVISDHEDKALIEKFFQDNPELAKDFEKLQTLNKMEETRKSRNIDVKSIRDRIRMESMTAWYADTSSFMSFTRQGAAYYSGINTIA